MIVAQSTIQFSDGFELIQAEVDSDVAHMSTPSTKTALDTTGATVQLIKFSVALYRYCTLLVKAGQVQLRDIPLRYIGDAHDFSPATSFRSYVFDYAKSMLSVLITFTSDRKTVTTKDLEGAASPNVYSSNEAECVNLPDECLRL